MKLLYCITKADSGGAQTHLIQLANHFSKNNEVHVIVGNKGPMLKQLDERIKVIIVENLVGPISFKEDILAIKTISQLIKKIKPDVLHFHSSKAGSVGRLAYKFSGVKKGLVVFTAHSWAFTDGVSKGKKIIYSIIEKLMLTMTDKVICVSKFDENLALKYKFNAEKLTTIHNGINNKSIKFSNNNEIAKDNNLVKFVMIARFAYPKMQKEVIEAIHLLSLYTNKNFDMTFIGDGETLEECKSLVDSLNLNQSIKFLGNVLNARNHLCNYDVFILMSKHEGLPISIIEAMSEGLPIIASDVGGINELVLDNGNLLSNNTPKELALTMVDYMDKKLINEKGKNSRIKFLNEYTENKMIKELEYLYGSISKKG
ncbi:glycosyltransferase family 4 protein [Staphylococcus simiae]|uniref:glycosyltransferase family 4 protein n=1 Tax=Staphylococcus simiae TaxID=308354 RepID=UPI001A98AE67|nr:glycosyltransferase family 4 protein [Staphylococcus simiae]MBO1198296.1 glycosyltransferase family 4 protein [Staphylococcus simiae]MBO1201969.1 glycosyltransferase family 4 protein [Staphylococcus simiae]MBO1204199.1 glycosyltransferase family 4 protein [Staphylococcus simiae]MBO1210288.1 glycosyltransferase family 4 protein [Staphylococcus simiae]MBO1230433.1 glycosyltransferase family 4 protein [Staphylococcus simiae]